MSWPSGKDMQQLQPGIFEENGSLYTLNPVNGEKVYGEKLVQRRRNSVNSTGSSDRSTRENGCEFREWKPGRSKAAAAIKKGVELGIEQGDEVLYLGAASGTTVSHFSDILRQGFIFAVEYSETPARKLVELAEQRKNIAPVIADARTPAEYSDLVDRVDVVYQDIAQRDQAEILEKNCGKFLKDGGIALMAVKAQSVSSTRDPGKVFGEVKETLEESFRVVEEVALEPYEKDHLFLVLEKI